jgi:cell division septal protein FtsQ
MKLREDKNIANTPPQPGAQDGSTNAVPKTEIPKTEAPKAAPKTKKPSGFQVVLKQVGLALLFLVIGMLGVLLALYLPASRDLKNAQTELERLVPIETQYAELQQSSAKTEQQGLVYKLMSETTQLRSALDESDNNKVTQYLTYMEEDLSQLDLSQFPDLPTSLSSQFEKIKTSISSTPTSAVSEVDKFYNSLLTLSDNLQ